MGGGSLLLIGPPSLLQVLIEVLQAAFDGQPEHLVVCSPAGRNVLMLDWKRPCKQTGPRLRPLLLY